MKKKIATPVAEKQAFPPSETSEVSYPLIIPKSILPLDTDDEVNEAIRYWELSEARNGTMLQCKDGIVKNVNRVGVAYFLAMATGIIFVPDEKTLWVKDAERGLWLLLDEDDLATRILDALNTFIKKALGKDFEFVAKQNLASEIVRRLFLLFCKKNTPLTCIHRFSMYINTVYIGMLCNKAKKRTSNDKGETQNVREQGIDARIGRSRDTETSVRARHVWL